MKTMAKGILFLALALVALRSVAARVIGFETDSYLYAVSASNTATTVFSPMSFEIDCVVVAESLDSIPKAGVSERMGVVIDFEHEYAQILDEYEAQTNGLSLICARGFCVPDIQLARTADRQYLERVYRTEVMRLYPKKGAESWFRATMDGTMEDFEIPLSVVRGNRYALYDLVLLDVAWRDPFPTANNRKLPFKTADDAEPVEVECMSDVRLADTWQTDDYTLLRLPLKGEAWFYALLPEEGKTLSPIRQDIGPFEINRLLAAPTSTAEMGVAHGPCAIVLPKMDIRSRHGLRPVFEGQRVPLKGLHAVAGELTAGELVQHTRFRLNEHGRDEKPLVEKPVDDCVAITSDTRKLLFNRPFVFFVYHQPTRTIPIIGQYNGPVASTIQKGQGK